jgi:uncharacterized protein (TIGR02118 family)
MSKEISQMVKVAIVMYKRKDLTREQFKNYWLNHHKKLELDSLRRDPVRKIVVSFATDVVMGAKDVPWDALVELYFDSVEDMKKQFAGVRDSIMFEDEKNFIDHSEPRILVLTEEYVIGEKPLKK